LAATATYRNGKIQLLFLSLLSKLISSFCKFLQALESGAVFVYDVRKSVMLQMLHMRSTSNQRTLLLFRGLASMLRSTEQETHLRMVLFWSPPQHPNLAPFTFTFDPLQVCGILELLSKLPTRRKACCSGRALDFRKMVKRLQSVPLETRSTWQAFSRLRKQPLRLEYQLVLLTFTCAALIHQCGTSVWNEASYIKLSFINTGGGSFAALTLSADGRTLVVADTAESSGGATVNASPTPVNVSPSSGAVHVFTRTSPTATDWQQSTFIKASNAAANNQFGWSLSISGDGNNLLLTAHQESGRGPGVGANLSLFLLRLLLQLEERLTLSTPLTLQARFHQTGLLFVQPLQITGKHH
jgi:hypothetical protein